jgi:uncharacterized Zn-finger protein
MSQNTAQKPIEVTAHDLPLHCPTKDAPLWASTRASSSTSRTAGEVVCPYCSAHYVFKGEAAEGHTDHPLAAP